LANATKKKEFYNIDTRLIYLDTACMESFELPILASPSASSDEMDAIDKMELSSSRSSIRVGGLMLSRLDWQLLKLELMSSKDVAFCSQCYLNFFIRRQRRDQIS